MSIILFILLVILNVACVAGGIIWVNLRDEKAAEEYLKNRKED
jgi:hypothetical protein